MNSLKSYEHVDPSQDLPASYFAVVVSNNLFVWIRLYRPSPALRIPTIQTRRTPIHDHQRLGAALVAHGGAGREAGAVAGDGDVLVAGFGDSGGGGRGYLSVFF